MEKIRPLQDRIIVKRVEASLTSQGGILIPETAKEKPQEGLVVSVGNGKMMESGNIKPVDVKAGDRVIFGKYSGIDIKIEDEDMLILREEDVLAVLQQVS